MLTPIEYAFPEQIQQTFSQDLRQQYKMQIMIGTNAYQVIYEKDFQNGSNCLGAEDKWSKIDGLDYQTCITSCAYKNNPGVPISLLSSQYSEKGFQLIISASKITSPYTIIGMDLLYMQPVGPFSFEVSFNNKDPKVISVTKKTTEETDNTINCVNDFPQLTLTTIHSQIPIENNQMILRIKKDTDQFNVNIKKIKIWTNCIQNCLVCSKSNSCGNCQQGFEEKVLPSGNKACEQINCSIQNCFSCVQDNTTEICMRCYPGFVLNVEGTACTQIGNQACNNNSYQDTNGNCINYSSICQKQDQLNPSQFSTCSNQIIANNYKCPAGQKIVLYYYSNYSVYNCECDITDCAICSSQDNTCQNCNTGYSYDSTSKQCKVINCAQGSEFDSYQNKCATSCIAKQYRDQVSRLCVNCTDTNCQSCTQANQCSTCSSGYSYDSNDKKCYINCIPQSSTYLDKIQNKCINCDPNCFSCTGPNQCINCQPYYVWDNTDKKCYIFCQNGFYLDKVQNQCIPCTDSNCQNCSSNQCTTCNSGYNYDTTDKKCYKVCSIGEYFDKPQNKCFACTDSNCVSCSAINQCTTCKSGYNYDSSDKRCFKICSGAQYLDKSQNNCYACTDINCISCTAINQCTTCNSGYNYDTTDKKCYKTCSGSQYLDKQSNNCYSCSDVNCQSCSSANQCTICNSGFSYDSTDKKCYKTCTASQYLDKSQNKCFNCSDTNCQTCSAANQCNTCKSGFNYDGIDKKCYKICPVNFYLDKVQNNCFQCTVTDCQSCSDANQCDTCKSGYSYNSTDKKCYSSNCANGQYFDYTQNKCLNCTDTNCELCSQANQCSSCKQLYSYDSTDKKCYKICSNNYYLDKTQNNCIQCTDTNCQSCTQANQCTTCKQGFNYDNTDKNCYKICSGSQYLDKSQNNCIQCTDLNCQSCSSVNQCTTCNSGFSYDSTDKKCYTTCQSSQYLDKGENKCYNCGNNCLVCTSNECTTCMDGDYSKDTNNTKNCSSCLVEGCSQCMSYEPNKCVTCNSGFHKKGDKCEKDCQLNNCQACSADGTKCTYCNVNYMLLANGQCQQVCDVENCLLCWDSSTIVCQLCKQGYIVEGGGCKKVCNIDNCIICASNDMNKCQLCQQGYNLENDGTCKLTCAIGYCSQCVQNDVNTCQQCEINYTVVQGKCLQFCNVTNCAKCQQLDYNKCDQCNNDYSLFNGKCYKNCLSRNCQECDDLDSNKCAKCDEGYYLDTDNQCYKQGVPQSGIDISLKQSVNNVGYRFVLRFSSEIYLSQTSNKTFKDVIQVQIVDATGFTYDIIQEQKDELIVELNTNNQNFKKRTLQINITDKEFIQDNKLQQTSFTQDLMPYVVITSEQRDDSKRVGTISNTASTVIVSSILPIAIFGNFYILINTIDITGFFYYNMFLNIRHPENVLEFFGYFKNFQFPFIPNMFEGLIDPNYSQECKQEQFRVQEYDNYFLKSTGQSVTIFFIVGLFYVFAKIGVYIKYKPIQDYCLRVVKNTWEFSGLLELVWNLYIYQLVGVLLQFSKYESEDKSAVFNYLLHTIISIPILILPFFLTYKVYSIKNIKSDQQFQIKYRFLISGVRLFDTDQTTIKVIPDIMSNNNLNFINEALTKKSNNRENLYHDNTSKSTFRKDDDQKLESTRRNNDMEKGRNSPVSNPGEEFVISQREKHQQLFTKYNNSILFVRKWIYAFLIIYLYYKTEFQIVLISFLHIGMIIYLIYIQPLDNKFENIKSLAGEIVLFFINICDFFLIKDNEGDDETTRLNMGWVIISLSAFILLLHTGQMLVELIKSVLAATKKLIHYIKTKKLQKNPSLNQTNDKKEEVFSEIGIKGFKFSADQDNDINAFQSNVFSANETQRKFSNDMKSNAPSKNNSMTLRIDQNETKLKMRQNEYQNNNSYFQQPSSHIY